MNALTGPWTANAKRTDDSIEVVVGIREVAVYEVLRANYISVAGVAATCERALTAGIESDAEYNVVEPFMICKQMAGRPLLPVTPLHLSAAAATVDLLPWLDILDALP